MTDEERRKNGHGQGSRRRSSACAGPPLIRAEGKEAQVFAVATLLAQAAKAVAGQDTQGGGIASPGDGGDFCHARLGEGEVEDGGHRFAGKAMALSCGL